ncbi:MAG: ornithine cyclodeaminase family protein [Bacteroidota bacterium]
MPRILDQPTILQLLKRGKTADLLQYIERSFTAYSSGAAMVPPVGTLMLEEPRGDVHIKYGFIKGEPYYVIKIASGFYDNPALGLPSSNGLNLVFSQKTGVLECILLDEGYLTDLRTALAGAVVAKHFGPQQVKKIGIVGTGIQARLQLENLQLITDCREVLVWGRSAKSLQRYQDEMTAKGYQVTTTQDAALLNAACNLIITATPSTKPILPPKPLLPGTLVIAMGADTPGKQELAPEVLQQADLIVLDSRSQCIHHGEIHKPWADGLLEEAQLAEIGELISSGRSRPRAEDIIVADLTGIATQDMLISAFVLEQVATT